MCIQIIGVGIAEWSLHQAGNQRVRSSNPGTSRQPLIQGFLNNKIAILKNRHIRTLKNNLIPVNRGDTPESRRIHLKVGIQCVLFSVGFTSNLGAAKLPPPFFFCFTHSRSMSTPSYHAPFRTLMLWRDVRALYIKIANPLVFKKVFKKLDFTGKRGLSTVSGHVMGKPYSSVHGYVRKNRYKAIFSRLKIKFESCPFRSEKCQKTTSFLVSFGTFQMKTGKI